MLLSCIIPIYNCADFLPKCLNSVLNIKTRNMEILLIDDGSKDISYDICKEYEKKDSRIHVVHQKNAGVSSARNRGILWAQGDYILFVDSDDIVIPDTISKFETLEPSKDFYLYDFYFDNEENYIKRDISSSNSVEELEDFFHFSGYNMVWNNLYKTNILRKNNIFFENGMKMGEDFLFNIKYIKYISSFQKINLPIYKYNSNIIGSATNKFNKEYIYDYMTMFNATWPYVISHCKTHKFNWEIYINGIYLNSFTISTKNSKILNDYEKSNLCNEINHLKPLKIKMKIKVWYLKHKLYRNKYISYIFLKLFVKHSHMIEKEK